MAVIQRLCMGVKLKAEYVTVAVGDVRFRFKVKRTRDGYAKVVIEAPPEVAFGREDCEPLDGPPLRSLAR